MSKVNKCDVCGSTEPSVQFAERVNNIKYGSLVLNMDENIDICTSCTNKLNNMINNSNTIAVLEKKNINLLEEVKMLKLAGKHVVEGELAFPHKADFNAALVEKEFPMLPYDTWMFSAIKFFSDINIDISTKTGPEYMKRLIYPKDRIVVVPVAHTEKHVLFYVGYKWLKSGFEKSADKVNGVGAHCKWFIVERGILDEYEDLIILNKFSGSIYKKYKKILDSLGFIQAQIDLCSYWEKFDLNIYTKKK